jgi:hypothetical protein
MKVASSFGLGPPVESLETRCGHNHTIPKTLKFKPLTWDNARPAAERKAGSRACANFLELIDVEPSLGRNLTIC